MNENTLKLIQTLTANDPKGLMGKLAKHFEEGGELARVILPYENAAGTLHRFVDKRAILDGLADNYLTLLSLLFDPDLGLSYDDLEEMVLRKAFKWGEIQQREQEAKFPVPFEIHVTVPNTTDVETFRSVCKELGVKPIFLDLELNDADVMRDYMTSSVTIGNNTDALKEVERISNGLRAHGFEVVREKIETVPWHPMAPNRKYNRLEMPKDCYFECHFGIHCPEGRRDSLENLIEDFTNNCNTPLHLSKNVFKKTDDGTPVVMATYRLYNGVYESFKEDVDYATERFNNLGWKLDRVITEFAIYDTKVLHDQRWIGT